MTAVSFQEKRENEMAFNAMFKQEVENVATAWLTIESFDAIRDNVNPQTSLRVMRAKNRLMDARRGANEAATMLKYARRRLAELTDGETNDENDT